MSAPSPKPYALAIDIGGTKIAAAVVDGDGALLGSARRPVGTAGAAGAEIEARAGTETGAEAGTEVGAGIAAGAEGGTGGGSMLAAAAAAELPGAESVFAAVRECAERAMAAAGTGLADLAGVGCGCAGPMRWPAGEVSPLNIPAWRAFPLRARLRELFAGLPVLVHNDGIALAVGEHWRGVGRDVRNLLTVTVSTGVGGGLILDGRLLHGSSGQAGHVGHVPVETDGPPCPCGGRGCVEAIAAGPRAVRRALAAGWIPGDDQPADGRALAASAAAGDVIACRELRRAGTAVGAGIAASASLLDLDAAVVAGGFAQSGPVFWDALLDGFDRHAGLGFVRRLRILPSADPAGAALRGAAAFVLAPGRYGWPD
ncbi:ROK family protein [Frankia canadensis]|nr:ROK family protein [Frankia canadensis]